MSAGYSRWFGFPAASDNLLYPRGMLPAGYLISSAEDLSHYMIALMNQGRYRNSAILSPQGAQLLLAPATAAAPEGYHKQPSGSYAMGWYVMEMNGAKVIAHDGDTPTFHADMILIPAGRWGVALLINTNTVLLGDDIRSLAAGVAALLQGSAAITRAAEFLRHLPVRVYDRLPGVRSLQPGTYSGHLAATHPRGRVTAHHPVLVQAVHFATPDWACGGRLDAGADANALRPPGRRCCSTNQTCPGSLLGGIFAMVNGILRSSVNAWKLNKGKKTSPKTLALY